MIEAQFTDISREVFGKYQFCTMYEGRWYADEDFDRGLGVGKPKPGALSQEERHAETRLSRA